MNIIKSIIMIISVDGEGRVIGGAKINDVKERRQYLNELQSSEKTLNGLTYQADNDGCWPHFLTTKYGRLIKIDGNNEQTVLYRVTGRKQLVRMYALPVTFLCMVLVVFFGLRANKRKKGTLDYKWNEMTNEILYWTGW